MEITKLDKAYVNLVLSSVKPENSLTRLSESNRKSLSEIIKYLSEINRRGLIDDKKVSELISIACANYIENEVEFRIDKIFNEKVLNFFENISI